ncbi:unnamed protein product [Gongylonema pulchrum]|uniref:FoP_duplication domain-containing protein n=1 Tax=Gongylonema pulchrum TaxID=637853 RepID=A0A183E0C9_9BILA|nr:unnamed protein product [Gongylonema pulchrum]
MKDIVECCYEENLAEDYDDDDDLEDGTEYVRIVPQPRGLLVPRRRTRARIPVHSRISYPVWRSRFSGGFIRRIDVGRPRAFGSLRYSNRNTRFVRNSSSGSSNLWRPRSMIARNRAPRYRNNRSFRWIAPQFSNKRATITREELDRDLEEYMKKGKHPPIDVSDLK